MDNESKFMWCAGFFQGEGYVGTRKSQNMALDIAITQYYDRTPLDKFRDYMDDGSVNGPYKNNKTDQYFQYRKTGVGAEEILKKMMPYLSGKKLKQAEKALQEINLYREQRGGFNKKNRPRGEKSHCKNGHDLSDVGRKDKNGYMICKTCHAKHKREMRKRKKNG